MLDDLAEQIAKVPGAKTMRQIDSRLHVYIPGQSDKVRPVRDQLVERVDAWLLLRRHEVVRTVWPNTA